MMEIRLAKQVNAPIGITFNVFSDITKAEERITGIKKVEILSDIKHGAGTRWRETRVMMGKEATEEMEISDYQPHKYYDVISESRGIKYHIRHTFTEQDGGTHVEMVFSGTPTTLAGRLMSVMSGLFAGVAKKALDADLSELKAAAEQQAAQG